MLFKLCLIGHWRANRHLSIRCATRAEYSSRLARPWDRWRLRIVVGANPPFEQEATCAGCYYNDIYNSVNRSKAGGASQNGGEFLATSGELHWDAQPATLDNPKSGMHPKPGVHPRFFEWGRVSGYLWGVTLGCSARYSGQPQIWDAPKAGGASQIFCIVALGTRETC